MKYSANFKNRILPIVYPIIASIVFTSFYTEIFLEAWYTEFRIFSIIVYILFLAYTLGIPLIIQCNFNTSDKGKEIIVTAEQKQIIIKKNNIILLDVKYDDICEVVIHQTNNYKQRTVNWFSWSAYYYYEIILKNGESYKISRLLIYDFDKKISSLDFRCKNYFIPLI